MDPISRVVAAGAAGAGAAAAELYVDDVFSTYLYDGNNGSQTITNGIDLSGQGGLVWIKGRDGDAADHMLFDTERGVYEALVSTSSGDETTRSTGLTAFNSNGFSLGGYVYTNGNLGDPFSTTYCSWTFRKAPGFFDVVAWTGNGTDNRALSHSLGSTPGFIAIKASSSSGNWICWHRNLTTNYSILLNDDDPEQGYNRISNIGASSFSVRDISSHVGSTNASGVSYVAYLFAHDDQSFGTNSDEAIVKCGSYSGNSNTTGPVIDLGFEPQWVMIKSASTTGDWGIVDTMRGQGVFSSSSQKLKANSNNPEQFSNFIKLNSTGFQLTTDVTDINGSGNTYIYVAIRRPHKPPSSGTDVFASQTNSPEQTSWTPGFAPDALFTTLLQSADRVIGARLTFHNRTLVTNDNAVEPTSNNQMLWDEPTGTIKQQSFQSIPSEGRTGLHYAFKRAPGFFDVVTYTGTGSAQNVTHNLDAVPELILVKGRDVANHWQVYSSVTDETDFLMLNQTHATSDQASKWNDTAPTSSVFTVNTDAGVNESTKKFIAYLFATLAGISKVGSYTGTGSNIDVDCGFTAGARFVLIKRTDSTGDWHVWDSSRGIVSGDDPYIELNTSGAQVTNTDYVDPLAAGFTVTSSAPAALNTSGGTYLFLAIA